MKKFQSLLCLLLCLAMALSLAACGEKKEEPGEQPGKETVRFYDYDILRLDPEQVPDGISPMLFTDEGFYGLVYPNTYVAETYDAEEEESETAPADETPAPEEPAAETPAPEEGETGEEEEQASPRLLYIGYDGTIRELSAYKQIPKASDPGDKTAFSSYAGMDAMRLDPKGELVAIESSYSYWFNGTEEERLSDSFDVYEKYQNTVEYYLRRLNEDGSEKSCVKLDIDLQDSWLSFYSCEFDDKGNLLVSGDQGVFCFDPNGAIVAHFADDIYSQGLVRLRDGTIADKAWGDNGLVLYPLDLEKKTLGEPIELKSDVYNLQAGDDNYDFYCSEGSYLYGINQAGGEKVKLLNWLDVDLRGDNLSGIHMLPDGSLICLQSRYRNEKVETELIRVFPVETDASAQKKTLTLVTIGSDWAFDRVIDFNRSHSDVRIKIVDYLELVGLENYDYDAARTKLTTEILSGSVPDLIEMNQLPYSQLAAKGLLEDLYPYLDRDPEMKREDFFPNVLKALEVKGGLYQIVSSFNVKTLMGASSKVGTKPGWTLRELKAALATMDEGCDVLSKYTTRGDLLNTLLNANMSRFVDWSTGECHFNNQDFIDILEFTKEFPAQIPDDMEWEDEMSRISSGRQMLTEVNLDYIDSILWYDAMFGKDGCTFIGYPTNEGVGSCMSTSEGYAMSVNCSDKEAAWEFLRGFVTYENQKDTWSGIPLSLKAYQERLKDAMTPNYERDENGKLRRDPDGNPIPIPVGESYSEDGKRVQIFAMSQAQADRLWDALSSCDKLMDSNDTVCSIVYELAQAYYSGQKTAEEAASLIESKVTIYINEQR